MKDLTFAIVDVETTGSRAITDRVIEIGILRIENGVLVETFHSLLNPEKRLPTEIEWLTGITHGDLLKAPTFAEIKDEVRRMLKDAVFVAHNVRFDYNFIKNEFARLDMEFGARCLCTVRLSRFLYPEYKRHGLDSLIERYGFGCASRHRALDDAKVLWDFLQMIHKEFKPVQVEQALLHTLKKPALPSQMDPEHIEKIPDGPGVYVFYGAKGSPLYVGKSIHLRDRVYSHFSSSHESTREAAMCAQVNQIKVRETSGELGALLLESRMIKDLKPLYNKRSRRQEKVVILKKHTTADGYFSARIDVVDRISFDDFPHVLGSFSSKRQAKSHLETLAEDHGLCLRLLELEKGTGPCFNHQIKKCAGPCAGKEDAEDYNLRFSLAFSKAFIEPWPYSGPVLVEEKNVRATQGEVFVIDQWRLLGGLQYTEFDQTRFLDADETFDFDHYRIFKKMLARPGRKVKVKKLKDADVEKLFGKEMV